MKSKSRKPLRRTNQGAPGWSNQSLKVVKEDRFTTQKATVLSEGSSQREIEAHTPASLPNQMEGELVQRTCLPKSKSKSPIFKATIPA